MYKITKTYTDYLGNRRTEDFYFNLTKAELMKMNLSEHGGMKAKMERMIQQQDAPAIMETFTDIIRKSYGERSLDGKHFLKSEERTRLFEETEAYSEIFMDLCTDAKAAEDFMNGILPPNLLAEANAELAKQNGVIAPVN